MTYQEDLDTRIRQMREAGESVEAITSALGVLRDVVLRIVREFETKAVLSARSTRFLKEIRDADDLDKQWKVGIMMQALRLDVKTQEVVIRHHEGKGIYTISLRELVDLTIPAVEQVKSGFKAAPLFAVSGVGMHRFWCMVSRLTQSDLGGRCNSEWRRRLACIGTGWPMVPIPERARQVLQMRQEGIGRVEVARKFHLSRSRIGQIEKRDATERAAADRRARLREAIRSADDLDKPWPVNDLLDAVGPSVATRKSLVDHFQAVGTQEISLRGFMDMCLDTSAARFGFLLSALSSLRGVGQKGVRSVINGLTGMDLGQRSNEEWRDRLVKATRGFGA